MGINISQTIPVPLFTPVETECALSSLPAHYLSPLFGKDIALFEPCVGNGELIQRCIRQVDDTSMILTILKVASYILSAGILPLLAILLNLIIRFGTTYQYVSDDIAEGLLYQREIRLLANSTQTMEAQEKELTDLVTQRFASGDVQMQRKYPDRDIKLPFFAHNDRNRYEEYKQLVIRYSSLSDEELEKINQNQRTYALDAALTRRNDPPS